MTARRFAFLAAAWLLLSVCGAGRSGSAPSPQPGPDSLVLEKLEWFQDMKLGLLMHWGPYSQWGVVESWSICPEDEDWCKRRGPHAHDYYEYRRAYENLKTTFDPVRFDPDLWAAAAREAGMRYVIFTTKHHDGFCMFDTKETDYRITDPECPFSSSPRSNITREIFDAFRRRGFGVGAYFSKPDWHCPDYWWPYFPPFDRNVNYDIAAYPEKWETFKTFTFDQIRELMSQYGPVDILWLDGGWVQPMTETSPLWGKNPCDQDIDMPAIAAMARSLQPGLIIVDRAVDGPYQDYRTPEQEVPEAPLDCVWETCMTMATSWSYVPGDVYKPAPQLIRTLVNVVAKGGNLLLNIGPSPGGEFPPEALTRLGEIGAWMKVNGEAIYRTRAVEPYTEGNICFTRSPGGMINAIFCADDAEETLPETIRIESFAPPEGSAVEMLGIPGSLPWKPSGAGFEIHVPDSVRAAPPCRYAWTFRFPSGPGASSGALELTRNGETDLAVYLGPDPSPGLRASADTLRAYIERISGARLETAQAITEGAGLVILEVGESSDSHLDIGGLGEEGFRIRTDNGSLYLTAGTERGIRNAVYTFLETYLGCRRYSHTVTVVPKRPTIALPPIDDTQVPVISFRMQNLHDPAYDAWHKLHDLDDWGLFVHTFKELVPPQRYFDDHPEYFSELGGVRTPHGQLCLTNPDVLRIVVEELRGRMEKNPGARYWSVSQNDTYIPCQCAACRAIDEAEGSPSGSLITFVNRVADQFPDKVISTLAYQYSRSAPAHLVPRPNVNIMLCSIECNRSRPIAQDPGSAAFVKDMEDWRRLTGNIFLWDYVIQFRNLVSPFPNLRVLQPNIRLFARNGIPAVFEQGHGDMHGEFVELRTYLIAKLLWDPYIDVDETIDDFLRGYYGAAAPHLRRYIDAMHEALAASGEDLLIYGYPSPSENGYLAPGMMDLYVECFDAAEEAVRDDPEFLTRVRTARLPLQFARLEQAKMLGSGPRGCFVENSSGERRVRPEIEALLSTFVEGCREAGIPRLWEHGTTPDEYEASTRRFLDESSRGHLARSASITLAAPASPKYHDGDASALIDGYRGWDDYRFHWLGFEGGDMEATIDLGAEREISSIDAAFLQDINSWIFMPLSVTFSVSGDGRRYREVGSLENHTPADREGAVIEPFGASFDRTRARYVRVRAVNMKTCPAWHKGSGGKAWIFADEIAVR